MQGKSKKTRRDDNKTSHVTKIIAGSVVGSVLFFVLLAVFAASALKTDIAASSYMPAGIILGALSAFVGGFISVRPLKEKGMPYGALSGLFQALICSIVLFVANKASVGTGVFILMAAVTAGSIAGGISAVNLKIKKKY